MIINRGLKQGVEMLKKEVSIDGTKYKVIINDSQPVNTYTSISGVGKAEISNLNHAEKNF
ncbi:hypothetical protein [uncultured Leptotrichia sp.]|uniref:hypothetical protein n=1 Tax=uncultured Leptotrichia sp. TaxID=159271 RepID=UPI0025D848BE|nr:hypothetical protein [uncultured Leptotrichia sp.]